MAWAARRERIRYEEHDCGGPFAFVYAPVPPEPAEEYEDALDHAVRFSELRPEWSCECGQRNRGRDLACCWCGETRDDLDQCK